MRVEREELFVYEAIVPDIIYFCSNNDNVFPVYVIYLLTLNAVIDVYSTHLNNPLSNTLTQLVCNNFSYYTTLIVPFLSICLL